MGRGIYNLQIGGQNNDLIDSMRPHIMNITEIRGIMSLLIILQVDREAILLAQGDLGEQKGSKNIQELPTVKLVPKTPSPKKVIVIYFIVTYCFRTLFVII